MKAAVLVKNGSAQEAFQIQELPTPEPKSNEVLIKAEAFGLNFADVMARQGLYQDCPPLPTVIGYEVVGHIEKLGSDVKNFKTGQRVVGFTRFGGYATHAVTDSTGVVAIADDMGLAEAAALGTQYCTAYFSAIDQANIQEGDHVLIQAAAGGVGTALVQLAKWKGCVIYGTAGSDKKLQYLKEQGVHYPINYQTTDFAEEVKKIRGKEKLDVVFDSLGGKTFRKGLGLLGAGGKIVGFGAAEMTTGRKNLLKMLQLGINFGIYHPVQFLTASTGLIGVNMLQIADNRPAKLERCLKAVAELSKQGILKPVNGGIFSIDQLAEAHKFLESRKSMGKVVVKW
jgi:NADPH2:quinone reductase